MPEPLKPCPFCGDKAVLKEDLRWHGAFRVECSSCDATVWATGENNPASAIAHWNQRVAPRSGVVCWVAREDPRLGADAKPDPYKRVILSRDLGDLLNLAPGECARVLITRECVSYRLVPDPEGSC